MTQMMPLPVATSKGRSVSQHVPWSALFDHCANDDQTGPTSSMHFALASGSE